MKMIEIYKRYLQGEKFKSISDIELKKLPIKHPADLFANSPIMQEIALKHSRYFKTQHANKK